MPYKDFGASSVMLVEGICKKHRYCLVVPMLFVIEVEILIIFKQFLDNRSVIIIFIVVCIPGSP